MAEPLPFPWQRVRQWVEIVETDGGQWSALIRHGREGSTMLLERVPQTRALAFAVTYSRVTGMPFPTDEWHLSGGGFAVEHGQGLSA